MTGKKPVVKIVRKISVISRDEIESEDKLISASDDLPDWFVNQLWEDYGVDIDTIKPYKELAEALAEIERLKSQQGIALVEKKLAEARARECRPENCTIEIQAVKKENDELKQMLVRYHLRKQTAQDIAFVFDLEEEEAL